MKNKTTTYECKCTVSNSINGQLKCKFEEFLSPDDFYDYKNAKYCIFHLPNESEFKEKQCTEGNVKVKQVLEGKHPTINNEVWCDYSYVILNGNNKLDIRHDEKLDGKTLNFRHAKILGNRKDHFTISSTSPKLKAILFKGSTCERSMAFNLTSAKELIIEGSNLAGIGISGHENQPASFDNIQISATVFTHALNISNATVKDNITITSSNEEKELPTLDLSDIVAQAIHIQNMDIPKGFTMQGGFTVGSIKLEGCKITGFRTVNIPQLNASLNLEIEGCEFKDGLNWGTSGSYCANLVVDNCKILKGMDLKLNGMDSLSIKKTTFDGGCSKFYFNKPLNNRCEDWFVLNGCEFKSGVQFEGRLPDSTFTNTIFSDEVDFSRGELSGKLNLETCTFMKVPNFKNVKIDSHVLFPKMKNFKERKGDNAAIRYHILYRKTCDLKHNEYEGTFYALYKRARRKNNSWCFFLKNPIPCFFSACYDFFSSYGLSFARPFIALIGTIFLFSGFYYIMGFPNYPESLAFSVQQSVKPFYAWTKDGTSTIKKMAHPYNGSKKPVLLGNPHSSIPSICNDSNKKVKHTRQPYIVAIKSTALFQSLLIIAFIALFLIGLRWNFRRG